MQPFCFLTCVSWTAPAQHQRTETQSLTLLVSGDYQLAKHNSHIFLFSSYETFDCDALSTHWNTDGLSCLIRRDMRSLLCNTMLTCTLPRGELTSQWTLQRHCKCWPLCLDSALTSLLSQSWQARVLIVKLRRRLTGKGTIRNYETYILNSSLLIFMTVTAKPTIKKTTDVTWFCEL